MSADGDDPVWTAFRARWAKLRPPLRPDRDVVAALAAAIAGNDASVLLLGVTPELAGLGRRVTAVDRDAGMVAHVWPGDDARARALCLDWRDMAPDGAPFTAAVGDGSLNVVEWPDDQRRVLARVHAALGEGGVVAVRCYVAPDAAEPPEAVRDAALAGGLGFHAFKWRLAMAVAGGAANVALGAIHAAFERLFPDRDELAARAGWSPATIAEIDSYAEEARRFSFPTRAQWRQAVPSGFADVRFVDAGSYPLAERCPLLVMRRV